MYRVLRLFALLFVCISLSYQSAHAQKSLRELSESLESVTQSVTQSVVSVVATGYRPSEGAGLLAKQRGTGSGVILDADGYIITNAHVIAGARKVQVVIPYTADELAARSSILKDTGRIVGGQVIGVDRETDLAVIKVQEKGLSALTLADSDDLRQGQIVLAFGSPFGLENSVSMGVVSSVARQLAPEHPVVYIQTDASINPGNSGGPLVNAAGEMVGINTMIFTLSGGSEGIGFSVPSNIVRNVFQQIRAGGRVRRGIVGVHAQTITPTLARGLGLEQQSGVVLGDVYPKGPADIAGLKVGDMITDVAGKPMENGRQFDVNIYRRPIGERVELSYIRDGAKKTLSVEVIERPVDPKSFIDMVRPEDNLVPRLGILAMDLTHELAAMLAPMRVSEGVVVAAQSSSGPAWRESFVPGDIIHSINGTVVRDIESLKNAVGALRPGDAVVAQIQRQGRLHYLAFEME